MQQALHHIKQHLIHFHCNRNKVTSDSIMFRHHLKKSLADASFRVYLRDTKHFQQFFLVDLSEMCLFPTKFLVFEETTTVPRKQIQTLTL